MSEEQIALWEECKRIFPVWLKQWKEMRAIQAVKDAEKLLLDIKKMNQQLSELKEDIELAKSKMSWLNMSWTYIAGGLPLATSWMTIPDSKVVERAKRT